VLRASAQLIRALTTTEGVSHAAEIVLPQYSTGQPVLYWGWQGQWSAPRPMTTPMSAERFADRFRYYKGQAQQQRGVLQLYAAISSSDQGSAILDEQAPWALTYSEQPPAPSSGLNPRGSEEVGMVGPNKPAPIQPGDSYLLVNDWDQDMEAYDHTGKILWKVPCLARGQGADTDWSNTNTDTLPVLYKLGKLYADYEQNPNPPCSDTAMAPGRPSHRSTVSGLCSRAWRW
jgi:hypothetical protein